MKRNAIIVGMPRSGTSMTASIFARKGYFVAAKGTEELRSGDEYNPSGYWEAQSLIDCNAQVFNAVGFEHDNTWLYSEISNQQSLNILDLKPVEAHRTLVDDFEQHHPWLWKDPRLCYTLGYWWPLLNPETTGVLLLKRDAKDIYQSFLRLKWRTGSKTDKSDTFKRVDDHIKAAEHAIRALNIPHIVVHYSEFSDDPLMTAQKISRFFGVELSPADLGYSEDLNNSHIKGRLLILLDRIADLIPDKIRKKIKVILPGSVVAFLYPHREK